MIIPHLPFIWRLTDQPNAPRPEGVPACLNFKWGWDARAELLCQEVTPELRTALTAIYAAGSENLGATYSYGKAFKAVLREYAEGRKTALEIGGGGRSGPFGKLFGEEGGPDCYDVDPHAGPSFYDPLGQHVHRGTFPCDLPPDWPERFDMAILHHVLEHVEDPIATLAAVAGLLSPGGTLIAAVPDCSWNIEHGDPSIATPQHLSYFTGRSLMLALEAAGFGDWRLQSVGGTLIVAATIEGDREAPAFLSYHGVRAQTFGRFYSAWSRMQRRVDDIMAMQWSVKNIGLYAPMRALPYVNVNASVFRLFDDAMAGKWLDGVERQIEGIADFEAKPVDVMFVMSRTHEREIVAKLAGRCKVITLREMLDV